MLLRLHAKRLHAQPPYYVRHVRPSTVGRTLTSLLSWQQIIRIEGEEYRPYPNGHAWASGAYRQIQEATAIASMAWQGVTIITWEEKEKNYFVLPHNTSTS
jgi:hypothetical protein